MHCRWEDAIYLSCVTFHACPCIHWCRGITEMMQLTSVKFCEGFTQLRTRISWSRSSSFTYFFYSVFSSSDAGLSQDAPRQQSLCINIVAVIITGRRKTWRIVQGANRWQCSPSRDFTILCSTLILNPKASLSSFRCTPSTCSYRSKPDFNSNSTDLDTRASGIVSKMFWQLLSRLVSLNPHFVSIEHTCGTIFIVASSSWNEIRQTSL